MIWPTTLSHPPRRPSPLNSTLRAADARRALEEITFEASLLPEQEWCPQCSYDDDPQGEIGMPRTVVDVRSVLEEGVELVRLECEHVLIR